MNRYFYILLVVFATIPYSQDPPDPPDAVTTVASIKTYPWGLTMNKLSGSGTVGVTNGSIGAFSYGNPALLNLHDKITMEFSAYDESMVDIYPNFSSLDRHIVPFSSFNIILPFKYKIGISYNNLYSFNSGEMEVTTEANPDGIGEYFSVILNVLKNKIKFRKK